MTSSVWRPVASKRACLTLTFPSNNAKRQSCLTNSFPIATPYTVRPFHASPVHSKHGSVAVSNTIEQPKHESVAVSNTVEQSKPQPERTVKKPPLPQALAKSLWTVEQHDEARHLLRAILREATYLPDPHARKYLAIHAMNRFKDYSPTYLNQKRRPGNPKPIFIGPTANLGEYEPYGPTSKPLHIILERTNEKIREARKSLAILRRANQGDIKAVTKILNLTYGRTGRQRRELLHQASIRLAPRPITGTEETMQLNALREGAMERSSPEAALSSSSTDSDSPALALSSSSTDSDSPALALSSSSTDSDSPALASSPSLPEHDNGQTDQNDLPQLTPTLNLLLKSQVRVNPPVVTRQKLKLLAPKIPDKNESWGRPMPWKRVRNLHAEWYAAVMDRLMPPLRTPAWEELNMRATGLIHYEPVKRRTRLVSKAIEKPVSVLEIQLGLRVTKPPHQVLDYTDEHVRPHTITRRFMQRRWADVFAQCPHMTWNVERNKWEFQWGCEVLRQLNTERATAAISPRPPMIENTLSA